MKGELTSVDKEKRIVTIVLDTGEKANFRLAEFIKESYLNLGGVSFSVDKQDNGLITYITADRPTAKPFTPYKKSENFSPGNFQKSSGFSSGNNYSSRNAETQEIISNQWAINAALKFFEINRADLKGQVTVDHIRNIAILLKDASKDLKKVEVGNGNS
jgi:hypothetical protein